MRHGEAVEYREPDHTRALTRFGTQQSENVGKFLHQYLSQTNSGKTLPTSLKGSRDEIEVVIDLALVSPYLRTQQTFDAVAKHVKVQRKETSSAVTPISNAGQCADLIHGYACDANAPSSLLVVTHMPLVSLLSSLLCAGINGQFFEPAGTLIIDYAYGTATGSKLAIFEGS